MTRRRLLRELRSRLDLDLPHIARLCGLPARPYTLEWAKRGEPVYGAAWTYASSGRIVLDYGWFRHHPKDVGALDHEYVHLIQNVPGGTVPGDVVEGFADAVRALLGHFDPTWWQPSPTALRIMSLTAVARVHLSQVMASGAFVPSEWGSIL